MGSSPRVRGLHAARQGVVGGQGIIPARAGFTDRGDMTPGAPGDHPRACGVYRTDSTRLRMGRGSSPRVRGLLMTTRIPADMTGIIPARAGFTVRRRAITTPPPDHPRACGVYDRTVYPGTTPTGSSPRVRGLPLRSEGLASRKRIIPARAGFTRTRHGRKRPRTDHPRACGVYSAFTVSSSCEIGSSPRVRGLLSKPVVISDIVGIIPARAGFT